MHDQRGPTENSTATRVFQSLYPPHLNVQIPPQSHTPPEPVVTLSPHSASSPTVLLPFPSDPSTFASRGLFGRSTSNLGTASHGRKLSKSARHDSMTSLSTTTTASSSGNASASDVSGIRRERERVVSNHTRPAVNLGAPQAGWGQGRRSSEEELPHRGEAAPSHERDGGDPTERDFEQALRESREQEEVSPLLLPFLKGPQPR